jgi:isopentenyldiphosphate isomerase
MNSLKNMEKLRKQIRESFFNPILHFLPLLIFLVMDVFFGVNLAWKISFPVAFALLIYIYFRYNRLFIWHLIFTTLYVSVGFLTSLQRFLPIPNVLHSLACETIFVFILLCYLLFQKQIQKQILRVIPRLIPMTNNFSELNRIVSKLVVLMLGYILGNVVLNYNGLLGSPYQQFFLYVYVGLLLFLVVYEMLRVLIIRAKLTREEWWPIVNEQGKIIGSIQHLTSLNDERKYMHPIARVLLIDKAMILLQKRSQESLVYPGLWDTVVSNHISMGETVEQCVERTAEESYSLTNFKFMYLANYTLEVEKESHYAFLFVSCQQTEYVINSDFTDQLKWWTQQQIEEELETGIFTENFTVEYDLLKRSGLLETGKCECNCKLKEVIYQQSNGTKKE